MASLLVINYLLVWGSIGSVLFTILVVIFLLTGVLYAAVENPDPKTKRKGMIGSLIILLGIIFIQSISTISSLGSYRGNADFMAIFVFNYVLYLILFLYDTLIIDILILVKWHPNFLRLPDEEVFTSAKYHLKTLIPGSILGLPLTAISVLLSVFIFK
ncbi:hypothetical protein CEE45_15215 [Candidatus Heimdallarchaeota archaeon B3_Heim]|nr:MAG: hypothetical protein CEE45_15215 [Candidatus Heimdallarchaeota archaeon B3_Heim]